MLDQALDRIADKLRGARRMGAQPTGASSHGLRLNPPLGEDAVHAVEARSGATLPEEYRAFITRLAGGHGTWWLGDPVSPPAG